MNLKFKIEKQSLERTDNERVVNETINYLQLCFTFSEDWEDHTKYVFFRNNCKNYTYPINEDTVVVPKEFLTQNRLIFGVYGIQSNETEITHRITTNLISILLGASGLGRDFAEIDETIWTTTLVEAMNSRFEDIDNEIENKVDKETGKRLSTNDFNNQYKSLIDNSKTLRIAAINQSSTRDQFTATIDDLTVESRTIIGLLNSKGYNNNDATLIVNDFEEKPIYVGNAPIQMYEWAFGRIGLFVYVTWTSINSGNGAWVLLNPYPI